MTMSAANASSSVDAVPPGLLHPLRHPAFALIAGATLVSNVGVWMRDTTSAWTVANETAHHSSVALVQAATMIPTLLLALPAGVLADHFDRRRILILCQVALAAAGVALAVLSYTHALSLGAIVVIALFAGSAASLAAPAFQAIVPALVPTEDLRPAVALSSVSFNIARVIGPAACCLPRPGPPPPMLATPLDTPRPSLCCPCCHRRQRRRRSGRPSHFVRNCIRGLRSPGRTRVFAASSRAAWRSTCVPPAISP